MQEGKVTSFGKFLGIYNKSTWKPFIRTVMLPLSAHVWVHVCAYTYVYTHVCIHAL